MLSDGLTAEQAKGEAREEVEVLDVAQMLLASVKGESATRAARRRRCAACSSQSRRPGPSPRPATTTQTTETVTETADVGPAAAAGGGSSLFDLGGDDEPETAVGRASPRRSSLSRPPAARCSTSAATTSPRPRRAEPSPVGRACRDPRRLAVRPRRRRRARDPSAEHAPSVEPVETPGGSLFDLGGDDEPETPSAEQAPSVEPVETPGGSLFDLAAPEPEATPEPEPGPEAETEEIDDGQARPQRGWVALRPADLRRCHRDTI